MPIYHSRIQIMRQPPWTIQARRTFEHPLAVIFSEPRLGHPDYKEGTEPLIAYASFQESRSGEDRYVFDEATQRVEGVKRVDAFWGDTYWEFTWDKLMFKDYGKFSIAIQIYKATEPELHVFRTGRTFTSTVDVY